MLIIPAVLLILFALGSILLIRRSSLPPPEVPSPTRHLEEKKETIYENLRDLQAEYHMGKLSDADYQQTKVELQRELAGVLAEIERINQSSAGSPSPSREAERPAQAPG